MKKALSLFLAVLMIFSCLAISTSAVGTVNPSDLFAGEPGKAAANKNQVVIIFNTNGGKIRGFVPVWDAGEVTYTENVTGLWAMVPTTSDLDSQSMLPTTKVQLPYCEAPDANHAFIGWELTAGVPDDLNNVYAGSSAYTIPSASKISSGTYKVIQFTACYTQTVVEEDTLTKVIGIVSKVFGAVIGLLMYNGDTAAGVALMNKIFNGIFA